MKRPLPRLLFSFLFLQFCLFSPSNALDLFGNDETIFQSGNNLIKYESLDIKKHGSNEHPIELDEKELVDALTSIRFWEKDILGSDRELEGVFSISTIRNLAKFIVTGLKNAKPEQDIVYIVQSNKPRLLILKQKFLTAGRAFYKDGKLNLIIGTYEYGINDALDLALDQAGNKSGYKAFLEHGDRDKKGNFKKVVLNSSGIENKKQKKTRRDWFVIDVGLASEAYLAEQKAKDPTNRVDERFEEQSAKLAKERREMRLEMARLRQEIKNNGGQNTGLTVEERLLKLDELKDKGLISEDEYNDKRDKVLEEL